MIVYFDICAAILFAVLIFAVNFSKMTKGIQHKIFLLLLSVSLLCSVFDIVSVLTDGSSVKALQVISYLSSSIYFVLRGGTFPVYILYIISLTDTWHKLKTCPAILAALIAPFVLILLLVCLNPLTDFIFCYVDGTYTRGGGIICTYLIAGYYMVYCIWYITANIRLFSRDKQVELYSLFPLTIIAVIIQFFYENLMVEMFAMAIACLMIITTVQRPEERIDTTTGFGNFKTFSADIGRTFINKKNIDIIYISISNFYSLEQILGIVPSLKLTKQIAKSIAETMKQCKIKAEPYYLGDGQFSLIISGKYKSLTQETAEALNTLLKQDVTFNDMQINLVAYICTGSAPQDCDNKETLIAMSNSIRHSMPYTGEVVKVSDITDKNTNQLNKNLDSIIDKALADRKFKVHYQPIYSTKLKRFTSAEALIRLTDEQYGYISPEIFIPAAEKNGTINKIGDYVLEEVCRFIASDQFKNSGLEYIEVNLSVSQCMQPTLADRVLETLKKYGVKANQINLEITETATTYSQNIMEENLQKLCDAGITFSMDDYGTGYSNIRSLASLPFDIIKLDKSFVAKKSNLRMQLVLKNTINMLKELNMKILVEGIETKEMLDYFIELKCDYVQGFYFSKPLPENDFVNFVKKNNN